MNKQNVILLVCFLLISLLYSGCEKDKTQLNGDKTYVEFRFDKDKYLLQEGEGAVRYYVNSNGSEARTWILDMDSELSYSWYQLKVTNFNINFINIPFEDIKPGVYDYSSDNQKKGVYILWMVQDYWDSMLEAYKMSTDFQNCVESLPEELKEKEINSNEFKECSNCVPGELYCLGKLDYEYFFDTREKDQISSSFVINEVREETIPLSEFCSKNGLSGTITKKILVGSFKCEVVSDLNPTYISDIEGSFRVFIYPNINKDIYCK